MRKRTAITGPVTASEPIGQHRQSLAGIFHVAVRRSHAPVPQRYSPPGITRLWESLLQETLLQETRFRTLSTPRHSPQRHSPQRHSPQCHSPQRYSPQPMSVNGLNHFNITASSLLIEKVKQFYIDIVGLRVGPRAHLDHGGYWLYADEHPILHLSARPNVEQNKVEGEGFFNHISLSCLGLQATISKMLATGTPYQIIELSDVGQTQIFITDPAGIGVELTFFDEQCVPSRLCSSLDGTELQATEL